MKITLRNFICFLLLVITANSVAQNPAIDSLEQVLTLHQSEKDTVRIKLLNELAKQYLRINPDKAIAYSNESIELSQKNNFNRGISLAYNNIGNVYRLQGKYKEALEYLQKALVIDHEIGDKSSEALSLNNIGNIYISQGAYDKSLEFYFKSLALRQEINDKNGIAISFNNIGLAYKNQGSYDKALEYYENSYQIFKEINDKKGIANSFNNFGMTYLHKGNSEKAIENYLNSLKIFEEIGDNLGQSSTLNNVGNIYYKQSNYIKALEYYEKSLKIKEILGDKSGIANLLLNIGGVYKEEGNYKKALENATRALKIQEEIGDKKGMVSSLINIGEYFSLQENFDKSLEYYFQSLTLMENIGYNEKYSETLQSIGLLYQLQGSYSKSLEYLSKALAIVKASGAMEQAKSIYYIIAETYAKMGNHQKSYEFQVLFTKLNDSLQKAQNDKAMLEMQAKYETEKKEKEIELLNIEKLKQEESQINQRRVLYLVLAVLALIIILAGTIYNRYRANKIVNAELELKNKAINKAKGEIELQKEVLEDKNQVITSSITYAKRIQEAILPTIEDIRSSLPDSFIFFQPKDIVSGDFYWFNKKDDKIFIAAVDCTGHGVPGAFMSMIGNDLLNQIANVEEITNPGEMLNNLHREVQFALKQRDGLNENHDGMDIALCCIDYRKKELQFASANRVLYFFNEAGEFKELKGDKNAIGGMIHTSRRNYSCFTIPFEKGDCFYIFSDGIVDQFGGKDEKKYGYKRLKNLFAENQQFKMSRQKELLDKTMMSWIGELEQVDDILVIGVRL